MPKQSFLVLVYLFFFQLSYAQWQWSNPQPSGYINYKVIFTSSKDGFIFNNNGDLINTTDGGTSWKIQQHFPNTTMMELLDSTGIIAGYNGTIFISPNNGSTWHNVLFPYSGSLNQVSIVSRDSLFMLRTSSTTGATELCLSTNRGTTWKITGSRLYIRSFQFLNATIGYAASEDGMYKSTDGGSSWQLVYRYPTTERFTLFKFLNENVGYAYKRSTGIVKTTDGGKTWIASASTIYSALYWFYLVSNTVAYAAGGNGLIYKTLDGGTSWQKLVPGGGMLAHDIYAMYFSASDSGFAVGHRGRILKTANGGSSWQEYAATYTDMKDLHFITNAVGYAATASDLIKTTDAGKSWSRLGLTLPDRDDFFRYIHFFNKDTGLAIADAPVQLYKTYDGGKNWRTVQIPNMFYNAFLGAFFTGNTGYLTTSGSPNQVYKTSDAGETWTLQSSDFNNFYSNLQFTDEKTGYGTVGPFIYKTQDSGRSWYQLLFEPGITINALWFVNPLTGYAAGNGGYLKRTSDSGHTWTRVGNGPGNPGFDDIHDIRFFNEKTGYLVNGNRQVYSTTDRGNTWQTQSTTPWECDIIEMTKDTTIYLAGIYGIILKRNMREYRVNSLKTDSVTACTAYLSASLTGMLSTVDSSWLEYSTGGSTLVVVPASGPVQDTTIRIVKVLPNLMPDSTYTMRLKIYYNGAFYYSSPVIFKTIAIPASVISINSMVLTSSDSLGNQWFLNNVPITGANQNSFKPTMSGRYTVQRTIQGCTGPMSEPYNYVVTAVSDPVLTEAVSLFPNPVTSKLYLKNPKSKKLSLTLLNTTGLRIKEFITSERNAEVGLEAVPPGVYVIIIMEVSNKKSMHVKITKL